MIARRVRRLSLALCRHLSFPRPPPPPPPLFPFALHESRLSSRSAEAIGGLLRGERCLAPVENAVVPAEAARAAHSAAELTGVFPMVGRAAPLQALAAVLSGQLAAFGERDATSGDINKSKVVPTCCGASGIGKSRFGRDGPRELLAALGGAGGTGAALDLGAAHTTQLRRALTEALGGGRVLRLGMEEELLLEEKKAPEHAIALRLLHAYGSTFAPYREAYPSYGALHEAVGLGVFDARKVVRLVQEHALASQGGDGAGAAGDGGPLLLYVNIDETNHLGKLARDWLKAAVSELTRGWSDKSCRVLVMPLLSGTNPAEVYEVSGRLADNIDLPLLRVPEYVEILHAVLGDPTFQPSAMAQGFLSDVLFNPRLLQVPAPLVPRAARSCHAPFSPLVWL
jgi:hypothetical protein